MDTVSLGLGASGVGCFVVASIGFFIARGLRSRCLVAGNVIAIDIHRASAADRSALGQKSGMQVSAFVRPTSFRDYALKEHSIP